MKRQHEVLVLNGRAFDVLLYLVQNPGRIISKEELLKNVWSDAAVDENNLAQNISTLRRVMTEKRGENGYIRTVPGQGYRFACAVRSVTPAHDLVESGLRNHHRSGSDTLVYHEETVRTTVVTEEKEETTKVSWGSRRRVWILAGSVLAVAVVTAASMLAWRHYHRIPQDPIVVLAEMENTTGEAGLGEVLASAVATDLKQSPYLNFLSPVHVQDTLAQMQLKKDVALTPGLARESGQQRPGNAAWRNRQTGESLSAHTRCDGLCFG